MASKANYASRLRDARQVSRGHVDAALAERDAPKAPLVVESLKTRLVRLLPDGTTRWDWARGEWSVWRDGRCLARADTYREAIERAIALHGGR